MNDNKMISLPASKSIMNRVLMINSFNLSKPIKINCSGICDDIWEMIDFKKALGYKIAKKGEVLSIIPPRQFPKIIKLHIENSATALRFIICRLAMMDEVESYLTVGKQLWTRPHQPLIKILKSIGARISRFERGFHIVGKYPAGGKFELDSSYSSQYVSALLLNAPLYNRDTFIALETIVSSGYVELTRQIMKDWGIETKRRNDGYYIPAGQSYLIPSEYQVENDVSSACYWWALGLIRSKTICVDGVSIYSKQPDIKFLDILVQMGADVQIKEDSISVGRKGELKAVTANMNRLPDQVPTLAVLALFAQGTTKISGIRHLRHKESDRINALCEELNKLGAEASYKNGVLSIKQLMEAPIAHTINSHGDHRIAMAFSLLTVRFSYIDVANKDVVKKSHPEFFENLENLQ